MMFPPRPVHEHQAHQDESAVTAAGRAYADGHASVDEVAAMLDLNVPDVIALLEEHGFRRSVDGLRLTAEARRERLRRIRADRVAREGHPVLSPAYVVRDVIASQRIEGVDVRPWLPRPDGT